MINVLGKTITSILFILTVLVLPCQSQPEKDSLVVQGYKAYAERDIKEAKKLFLGFLKTTTNSQNPDVLRARLGLAHIYIFSTDLKNVSEGRKHLQYIIDKSDERTGLKGQAIFLLGRSFHLDYSVKGEEIETALEQARVYYQQYLDQYPKGDLKSRTILYLAQVYLRRLDNRDVDRAIDLLEDFLNSEEGQKDEYFAQIAYALGQIYHLRKNDLDTSVRYLSLAVEKGIEDYTLLSNILYKIANIYDKFLEEPVKALKYYNRILNQFPVDSRVNVIRRRIKEIESNHE